MRRNLRKLAVFGMFSMFAYTVQGQRFLTEVFPSVNVTPSVIYSQNYEVLTGTPVLKDLKMDIYEKFHRKVVE